MSEQTITRYYFPCQPYSAKCVEADRGRFPFVRGPYVEEAALADAKEAAKLWRETSEGIRERNVELAARIAKLERQRDGYKKSWELEGCERMIANKDLSRLRTAIEAKAAEWEQEVAAFRKEIEKMEKRGDDFEAACFTAAKDRLAGCAVELRALLEKGK